MTDTCPEVADAQARHEAAIAEERETLLKMRKGVTKARNDGDYEAVRHMSEIMENIESDIRNMQQGHKQRMRDLAEECIRAAEDERQRAEAAHMSEEIAHMRTTVERQRAETARLHEEVAVLHAEEARLREEVAQLRAANARATNAREETAGK